MQVLKKLSLIFIALFLFSCGEDGTSFTFQSQRCNDGEQATLTLTINGLGTYTFTDGNSAVSHASYTTDGIDIDAVSMFMVWIDPATGDSIRFDITVENSPIFQAATYTGTETSSPLTGTVNFYIYRGGVEVERLGFQNFETTLNEFEVYETLSGGGITSIQYAFMSAMTSGTFIRQGPGSSHAFTSSYTICPRY